MGDIVVEISGTVRLSPGSAFDRFANMDLPAILRGYGPLPAVAAVEGQEGAWDEPGKTRTILLSDGSRMREELLAVDRPRRFTYRVSDLTGPFRLLTRGFRGEWSFEAMPGAVSGLPRTRVRWRYEFEPRSAAVRPAAVFVVKVLWRRIMERALVLARERAEAAGA